ncbi:hypothetical protein PUR61_41165 [Streptomyces sp. BE20]|uniref:hypothetical protein n=1 Tax=Streptomyces sp. BE20 TaxID=3002525 RepID=UPI002E79B77B|nr:hypothetical protein [Streptomyces sp. BE20]MEE1828534.1 hypothetical protein [Streptomyces sp. BE20]
MKRREGTAVPLSWSPVLPAALTALLLCAGPARADDGGAAAAPGDPDAPAVARAFDGDAPLPDAPALARGCGKDYGCEFRIIPGLSRELTTAVVSAGNAAINCTNKPIVVERTVTLESSTTDNIAGEISGSATLEGTIDNTTNVSGSAGVDNKTEISHTDHTAPTDKGPNADIVNGASLGVAGSVSGAAELKLSAKATFALAFQARYSHTWKRTSTETTQVKFTVKSGDELQFGVLNAMTRTVGELTVNGTGKLIKNIVVDSPSSVNVSTVVAQTFSARDRCLSLHPGFTPAPNPAPTPAPAPPPGNRGVAGGGVFEAPPRTDGARPVGQYRLTSDGRWASPA